MLDARAVAAVDPGGMREIIASLPDQLSAGMKVGESTRVPIEEAQRIFIVGMGGSAIGGDVFASWIADRAKVPIQVVRDYRIPAYGRPEDLLIAVSYSGNTEETLAATTQGLKLGCRVVAITSGGTLRDLVRANDMRVLPVPTGLPPSEISRTNSDKPSITSVRSGRRFVPRAGCGRTERSPSPSESGRRSR